MSDKTASTANPGYTGSNSPSNNAGDATPPLLKPFAQSAPSTPAQPRSAFHPDVPAHQKTASVPSPTSRNAGIPGGFGASNDSQSDPHVVGAKQLMIGSDVCLKGGSISACDHLILDGTLEDTSLMEASHLDITAVGYFKGTAVVENAEVSGKFEGDLTVRGRLTLRESGQISGSVKYGSIVIEPGGTIKGDMQSIADS